ncbi:hypothetical protein V492_06648 [Pseudogymnoascus sp. VKM F-4246]|nr:hypothetical protein V492_06648 [Pseudogymnoascus sp. VKM F-4246]
MLVSSFLLLFAGMTSAHTTMQYDFANGQENSGNIRKPPNNNPVTNVNSADMACNVNGNNPASQIAATSAGSSVTFEWHWEDRSTEAIAETHKGPIITWMAKVGSATSEQNPSGLNWFKIAQTGLSGSTWAVDTLRSNGGKWTFTIPSSIQAGEYLVRQEIIALHSAYSSGGAQFYIGCAQIKVTGGGSASPATYKIPGVYNANDPSILINIYNGQGQPYPSSYNIPGPAVFQG